MAKGRKNGCPVNIKNWIVMIEDKATSEFVRIFGLNSLNLVTEGDTEDGSSETDTWAEPYVTKRSGNGTLEGKPVVVDSTGEVDPGQALLTEYARAVGCEGDATLKFIDPYGHASVADYIVTNYEQSSEADGDTVSWDIEQVGEAEILPYVHVASVALKDGETALDGSVSLTVGGSPKIITVNFTPATSSNQRFRVTNTKRTVCTVGNVTDNGFTITAIAAGTSTITVTSVEGGKTATLTVTVSDPT